MPSIDLVRLGPCIFITAASLIGALSAILYIDFVRRIWASEPGPRGLRITSAQLMAKASASTASTATPPAPVAGASPVPEMTAAGGPGNAPAAPPATSAPAGTPAAGAPAPAAADPAASEAAASLHKSFLEGEARAFEAMLICGSIGLAAWSQLFVSWDHGPASRLSGLTLGLLFTGSAWLLAAPLIWRRTGSHLTSLGRNSALRLGFSIIVISLSSMILDLRIPFAMGIGIVIVCVIVVRECCQTVDTINMHRLCLKNTVTASENPRTDSDSSDRDRLPNDRTTRAAP
jgi:hypothetical protein